MKRYSYLYSILLSAALLCSCQNDEDFDNKVFINSTSKVGELLLKGSVNEIAKTIEVSLSRPAPQEINITYKADESLVKTYNQAYYDDAIMLPADNYELGDTHVIINTGSVRSKETTILFKNLTALDREIVYVLPITIESANIDILQSARTQYFVVKGAALINVVADIEENYLTVNWKNPDVCNGLSQLTLEALIRARDFDRQISTVMGIEGKFLIRLGDAGFPSNQIQIATSNGNFPDGDSNKGLPTNEWVHIAVTYDSSTGAMIVYVNGKKQSEGVKNVGSVNLGQGGTGGFCIGRSYADERFLAGEISECRIWNIVRTQEEIANNPYYVDPASDGLVAYWKFDDESALSVKDHTANGNDAVAKNTLKWTPVTLPAPNK